MPARVLSSVTLLSPYEPAHIGPLVAKEARLDSVLLKFRVGAETVLASTIGFLGSSLLLQQSAAIADSGVTLMATGIAVASGIATWSLRRHFGKAEERLAKLIGTARFGDMPRYESASEALTAADTLAERTFDQCIALRHAMTHSPLLYGAERSEHSARILRHAESSFPGRLLHLDAVFDLANSTSRWTKHSELELLTRNILSVLAPLDLIEKAELASFNADVMARRKELSSWCKPFVVKLFEQRFDDPRAKCESLNLARILLDKVVNRDRKEPVLTALRENTIEVLLACIPQIPSPADKLFYLEHASKVSGLDADQKRIVSTLIGAMRISRQLTEGEEYVATGVLGNLTNDSRSEASGKMAA